MDLFENLQLLNGKDVKNVIKESDEYREFIKECNEKGENAIGIILASLDDSISGYADFDGSTYSLVFDSNDEYLGTWDVDFEDIENIAILDNISAEVEASFSGLESEIANKIESSLNNENISIEDLINCYNIDELQKIYDYVSSTCDNINEYVGEIYSVSDFYKAMNKLNDKDCIKFNYLSNCLTNDELQKLYDYTCSNKEIKDLKESNEGNSSLYTLNFGSWRTGNGKSFKSKLELVKWLRSNYVDLSTIITYSEDVTDNFKFTMKKIHHSDIKDEVARKSLFDKGYVAIKDVKNDVEESVKLEKLSTGNKLQSVFDSFNSNIKLIQYLLKYIDESTIEKMYDEVVGNLEEATSGIGAGAYTTKALDIVPNGIKKY